MSKYIKLILQGYFFLFPLFYLSLTAESYEYNKLSLLLLVYIILSSLVFLKFANKKRFEFNIGSFGLPLILLSIISTVSTMIQTPNAMNAIITPLSTSTIILSTGLYLLLVNLFSLNCEEKYFDRYKLIDLIVLAGVILSIFSIFIYLGIFPNNPYTPAGTLLSTAIFLGLVGIYLFTKLIISLVSPKLENIQTIDLTHLQTQMEKTSTQVENFHEEISLNQPINQEIASNNEVSKSDNYNVNPFTIKLVALGIIFLATGILTYHLHSNQNPIILPFSSGWPIMLDIFKNIKTFLLGVGPTNFISAYTLGRPISINTTPFWNVVFTTSSSYLFTLATETGFISFVLYLLILFLAIKILLNNSLIQLILSPNKIPSTDEPIGQAKENLPLALTLTAALVIQMILPSNMAIFIFTVILLAYAAKPKKVLFDLTSLGRGTYLILVPVFIINLVLAYFGGKYYLAEYYFKKSLDAYVKKDGKTTYDLQLKTIKINAAVDRYHLVFSQTNLTLANALAAKKELTDEDKQSLPKLIQQSIDEARIAINLNKTSIINWDNLANVYTNLINFAVGARDWAAKTYQQKIQLDPNNPNARYAYGQLLYNTKTYSEAESVLKQAIYLKPDYANAHYLLSLVLRENKKPAEAYQELQIVQTLIPPSSPDGKKVAEELNNLAKMLPDQAVTPSITPTPSLNPESKLELDNINFGELGSSSGTINLSF